MLRSPDDLVPPGAPEDLRRFVAYWIDRAAGRLMPAFAEIDPVDIRWSLSRVYVVRVVDGGADFVYRLAGEAINLRYQGSIAGKRVSDLLEAGSAAEVIGRWRRVIETPAAYFVDSEHPTSSGLRIRGRRVALPLGPAGGPADHIIGLTVFEARSEAGGAVISGAETHDVRWVELGTPDEAS
jgi:hypothetical protein